MLFIPSIFSLFSIVAIVSASPRPLRVVEKFDGPTSGRFIVKLKDGVSKTSVLEQVRAGGAITHSDWEILNGFAGHLDAATVEALRASPDVEFVAEDGIAYHDHSNERSLKPRSPQFNGQVDKPSDKVIPFIHSSFNSRTNLGKISDLTFSYTYDASAGAGVDIYIVDTGVLTTHSQFGGRARWGATFGGYPSADGNGHGTHCAGTASGSQFGVAKAANIIAVKVLSDAGSGAVADIVSGLNFVLTSARASGRPSIVSMSLGGSASTALDNAVASLTSSGIHVAVAAGNSNANAGTSSPARALTANTVGASTIADVRASFSNFGAVVDIFAPGQNVISSWIGSNTATNNISGTSMATPHVAGLLAYLISLQGNDTPAAMTTKLKSLSVKGVLTGIPSGTLNDLAHNV